jgi:AcrR family transcriptional regulator
MSNSQNDGGSKAQLKGAVRARKPRGLGHERRGEILAAAKQLFIKEGYDNFTTRKLARRVGLSQTGVYVYFKSKDEILDAVCRTTFEALVRRFGEMAEKWSDSPDLFRKLGEAYRDFALQHPDEYRLTFMSGQSAPKFNQRKDLTRPMDQQSIGVQAFLLFRDRVGAMMQAGHLRAGDVTLVAQIVWAAIHGLVSLMIARPGYLLSERRELFDQMMATLMTGLRPLPPRRR